MYADLAFASDEPADPPSPGGGAPPRAGFEQRPAGAAEAGEASADVSRRALAQLSVTALTRSAPAQSLVAEARSRSVPVGVVSGRLLAWFERGSKGERLGSGSFATVVRYTVPPGLYGARGSQPVDWVAVKRVRDAQPEGSGSSPSDSPPDETDAPSLEFGISDSLLGEMAAMSGLRHPNVLALLDAFTLASAEVKMMCLVFPLASGALVDRLRDDKGRALPPGRALPLAEARRAVCHLLRAVAYCQSRDVLHGDIKPHNVLVVEEAGCAPRYVLADFGLARTTRCFAVRTRQEVFTLWYRAPELLLGSEYGPAADVWAVACTAYEALTARPLFPGDSEIDELFRMFRTLGTATEASWPGVGRLPEYKPNYPSWPGDARALRSSVGDARASEFVLSLLVLDPARRPTAQQALGLPWLAEARAEAETSQCLAALPADEPTGCVDALLAREAAPTGSPLSRSSLVRRLRAFALLQRRFREPAEDRRPDSYPRDRALALALLLYGECQAARDLSEAQDGVYASACAFLASALLEDSRINATGALRTATVSSRSPEKTLAEDAANARPLEAAVADVLLCHGGDLYVATSHDVLEALLEEARASKPTRAAARTLLQCSYAACLGDSYRPRLVALLCESLGCEASGEAFAHKELARSLEKQEVAAATRLLAATLAGLWLSGEGSGRSFTPAAAESFRLADRGFKGGVRALLHRTRVLAALMDLPPLAAEP